MQQRAPLVSVLMTAYNRQGFIGEAIESVLASSYQNFELIIVDDGSKDNTVNIADSYSKRDGRIRLFINEKNLGDYPNRNRAAGYANGEFIMYVDSDDVLYEATIEKYVSFLTIYPSLNFAIYSTNNRPDEEPQLLETDRAIRDHYLKKSYLLSGPGGIFMRRDFFKSLNGFPENYGPANDSYFNVKAASQTDVLIFSFVPLFYRRHNNQESNDQFSYIYNNYKFNKDLINKEVLPLLPEEKNKILKKNKRRFVVNIFRYLITTGNFIKTIELVQRAEFSYRDALEGVFH